MDSLQTDLETYVERRIVLAQLSGRPALSEQALADIERTQAAYGARSAMLRDLTTLYGSFGALAAYDAATEVEAGVKGLLASANEFALATGQATAPLNASMQDAIGKATAAIATAEQNRRLKLSSQAVRACVRQVGGLLQGELPVHASVRQTITDNAGTTAAALATANLAHPHPLLRGLLGSEDFSFNEDGAAAQWAASPELRAAVIGVVQRRTERRAQAQIDALVATLSTLQALERAHETFEAGQPLDVEGIAQQLAALRLVVAALHETPQGK